MRRRAFPVGRGAVGGVLLLALLGCLGLVQAAQAETAHDTVAFSCRTVSFTYAGFPEAGENTVTELLYVDGATYLTKSFSFEGSSGTDSISLSLSPGHHKIDARARWKTNGVRGGHDQPLKGGLSCDPEPDFSIEKLQEISRRGALTTATLFGARREIVHYEIVVRNTGNVPLTLGALVDGRCDAGTLAGGPGGAALDPGLSATFTCQHRLTPADQALGVYENVASVTATPPSGEGPPLSSPSNPVLVELPHDAVGFSCSAVTLSFANFPDALGNIVMETVYVDRRLLLTQSFSFDGPVGSNTIPLELPPGHHSIDVRASWSTNGATGGHDQHLEGGLKCVASPEG